MRCPFCGHGEDRVVDSREVREGSEVRRRRECLGCGRRFTTYERVEALPAMVVKRDGRREPFDRGKLLAGLAKACEKRPVPRAELERIVEEVEGELVRREDREMSTETIGNLVIERLKALDQVAYVRFASVYRRFRDIDEFMRELEALRGEEGAR